MRALKFITLPLIAAAALLVSAGTAAADPVNPSFETGNLNGWDNYNGGSGSVNVVTECDTCNTPFSPYAAQSGTYFALLTAGDPGNPANVTQRFSVPGGSTISGWVFFCNDEESNETEVQVQVEPSDCQEVDVIEPLALRAAVELTDAWCDEALVAYKISGGPATEARSFNACEDFSTDWTRFEFEVPGSCRQQVEIELYAGIANYGDSLGDSSLGLDNIQVDSRGCAEDRRPPNIGAGLSGLFNGMPTPLPTAPSAVAPASTSPVITPPRTGDAGLAGESATPYYGAAVVLFALAAVPGYRLLRR